MTTDCVPQPQCDRASYRGRCQAFPLVIKDIVQNVSQLVRPDISIVLLKILYAPMTGHVLAYQMQVKV